MYGACPGSLGSLGPRGQEGGGGQDERGCGDQLSHGPQSKNPWEEEAAADAQLRL